MLKHHGLVKPAKEFDKASKRHKTVGVVLTLAGKEALGYVDVTSSEMPEHPNVYRTVPTNKASLNDVAAAVKTFQESHPEFDVVFDVKFKGVQPNK